jgi:hypothetical protein
MEHFKYQHGIIVGIMCGCSNEWNWRSKAVVMHVDDGGGESVMDVTGTEIFEINHRWHDKTLPLLRTSPSSLESKWPTLVSDLDELYVISAVPLTEIPK